MTHWAHDYIGIPWEYGARGPHAYDCWGFVCEIERVHFKVLLPPVNDIENAKTAINLLKSHNELANWDRVDNPVEGDLVMMARARFPAHIGVCIHANRESGVLHCLRGSGVIFQPFKAMRMAGWGSLMYYRRKV